MMNQVDVCVKSATTTRGRAGKPSKHLRLRWADAGAQCRRRGRQEVDGERRRSNGRDVWILEDSSWGQRGSAPLWRHSRPELFCFRDSLTQGLVCSRINCARVISVSTRQNKDLRSWRRHSARDWMLSACGGRHFLVRCTLQALRCRFRPLRCKHSDSGLALYFSGSPMSTNKLFIALCKTLQFIHRLTPPDPEVEQAEVNISPQRIEVLILWVLMPCELQLSVSGQKWVSDSLGLTWKLNLIRVRLNTPPPAEHYNEVPSSSPLYGGTPPHCGDEMRTSAPNRKLQASRFMWTQRC